MNFLQVGFAPKHFEYPSGSLVITDEPAIESGAKLYDPAEHGLNPLPMKYRESREFAAAAYPDKDLMAYRNGRRALTRLIMNADRLDACITSAAMSTRKRKASWKILCSRRYCGECCASRFRAGSMPEARLLRARKEIGDDDAKIIANIRVSQFKGQIVVEDFGFYAREHHSALIRQERLIAGVYTLSELPEKLRATAPCSCRRWERDAITKMLWSWRLRCGSGLTRPGRTILNRFIDEAMA
jgi:hypothetical protein